MAPAARRPARISCSLALRESPNRGVGLAVIAVTIAVGIAFLVALVYHLTGDFATEIVSWGPKDERMTLNPTGVLAVAGIVIATIGLVFDALAR